MTFGCRSLFCDTELQLKQFVQSIGRGYSLRISAILYAAETVKE